MQKITQSHLKTLDVCEGLLNVCIRNTAPLDHVDKYKLHRQNIQSLKKTLLYAKQNPNLISELIER